MSYDFVSLNPTSLYEFFISRDNFKLTQFYLLNQLAYRMSLTFDKCKALRIVECCFPFFACVRLMNTPSKPLLKKVRPCHHGIEAIMPKILIKHVISSNFYSLKNCEHYYFHTLSFIFNIIYLITNKTKQLFHNSGFKKDTRGSRGDRRIANVVFYMIKTMLSGILCLLSGSRVKGFN